MTQEIRVEYYRTIVVVMILLLFSSALGWRAMSGLQDRIEVLELQHPEENQ